MALVHPDDAEKVGAAMELALQGRGDYNIEHRVVRPDGKEVHIHARGELSFNAQGEVDRMLSTIVDITEKKRVEVELTKYRQELEQLVDERTQALSDANEELIRKERLATLGQLTATISHELRNPLGAMRPALYLINKKIDKSKKGLQEAMDRLARGVDRCDQIIDELLDFTRISLFNGEMTQLDPWLQFLIKEQNIPGAVQLEKDFCLGDKEVHIDPSRFRRAIINVLENGWQAMLGDMDAFPDPRSTCLRIATRFRNQRVEVAISDTGVGMSEQVLEKIFEPLFSTKGFGVGLGMPTVKQIMEQHAGGIEIESVPLVGTTVTLWLPDQAVEESRPVAG